MEVKISPHEAFELHELLVLKCSCATKSATMMGLVNDEELKTMLQHDLEIGKGHIKELQNFLQAAYPDQSMSSSYNEDSNNTDSDDLI